MSRQRGSAPSPLSLPPSLSAVHKVHSCSTPSRPHWQDPRCDTQCCVEQAPVHIHVQHVLFDCVASANCVALSKTNPVKDNCGHNSTQHDNRPTTTAGTVITACTQNPAAVPHTGKNLTVRSYQTQVEPRSHITCNRRAACDSMQVMAQWHSTTLLAARTAHKYVAPRMYCCSLIHCCSTS